MFISKTSIVVPVCLLSALASVHAVIILTESAYDTVFSASGEPRYTAPDLQVGHTGRAQTEVDGW